MKLRDSKFFSSPIKTNTDWPALNQILSKRGRARVGQKTRLPTYRKCVRKQFLRGLFSIATAAHARSFAPA